MRDFHELNRRSAASVPSGNGVTTATPKHPVARSGPVPINPFSAESNRIVRCIM